MTMLSPCCRAETAIADSRPAPDRVTVQRRRKCLQCDSRFNTVEAITSLPAPVGQSQNIPRKRKGA